MAAHFIANFSREKFAYFADAQSVERGSSRQDLVCARVSINVCMCARVLKKCAMYAVQF